MRRVVPIVLAALVAVVAVVLLSGGSDTYTVKLRLANAQGLRKGSPIVVGGVPIGTVDLDANQRDVVVKLNIKRKYAPIGRNATAAVIAQNVLGQKQVRITPGDKRDPAPEGYTIPSSQIIETTDLDQLLATLDPDTRTRLAVLINETGTGFAGRKLDFKHFLRDLAPALSSGTDVLGQLTRGNRTLTRLLDTSDHFVAAITPQRRKISRMLDVIGQMTETVAARRAALRETLRRAPGGLASARGFLAELRQTTHPLAITGRQLAAAAPSLQLALDRIEPFRRAAAPALATVRRSTAPALRRLGVDGTPALRRVGSTAERLKALSQNELPPVGGALNKSVDNLFAVLENWSRAIQFRDRLGHMFRGEASIAPDLFDSVIGRLAKRFAVNLPKSHKRHSRGILDPARHSPAPLGQGPDKLVGPVGKELDKIIHGLSLPQASSGAQPRSSENKNLEPLLGYLLR